ncbi:MAG: hypothetical protein GWN84_19980 [Gammaproteobacteria bacterium]|nr:hypothetical protein [Gammaproteobacteria bacterium]NIR85101.1 hypothetical protein [Gammaproteobacteria bacterium]NIR92011.1 hypothetical protein [Gammaproteobacteria bacterium]NIU06150.1 hypothetical protein [Gammaproteobacteria bacterium]NIV53093.1 hypothetical protein [Gammaproteobacteria bacterium]
MLLRATPRESFALLAAFVLGLLAHLGCAQAEEARALPTPTNAPSSLSSVLDGMTFAGQIGPIGKAAFTKDVWKFREGTFVSTECEKTCGFERSSYWVLFEQDAVRFISEARCPDERATILWKGVVRGDEIEGTFTWKKERWYWTIEKDFWFKGTLVEPEMALAQ